MSKFKVYLAGKMSGLTYEEMNAWRVKASMLFEGYDYDIHTLNPVDFYNFEMDKNTYTEREVKRFDLGLVRSSDVILVNLDHPNSIGTAIEIHESYDNWKIPVIGFGTTVNHPWIMVSLDKQCETLEEAVEHIVTFYASTK